MFQGRKLLDMALSNVRPRYKNWQDRLQKVKDSTKSLKSLLDIDNVKWMVLPLQHYVLDCAPPLLGHRRTIALVQILRVTYLSTLHMI